MPEVKQGGRLFPRAIPTLRASKRARWAQGATVICVQFGQGPVSRDGPCLCRCLWRLAMSALPRLRPVHFPIHFQEPYTSTPMNPRWLEVGPSCRGLALGDGEFEPEQKSHAPCLNVPLALSLLLAWPLAEPALAAAALNLSWRTAAACEEGERAPSCAPCAPCGSYGGGGGGGSSWSNMEPNRDPNRDPSC